MRRSLVLMLAAVALSVPVALGASQPSHAFRVVFLKPRTQDEATIQTLVKASQIANVMAELSKAFVLPTDIIVVVKPGSDGPYYNPKTHIIVFNDDFSALALNVYTSEYPKITSYKLGQVFASLEYFVLFHEIGHAFVDLYNLPILGREEDAVDAISTVFMTEFVPNGGQIALAAADFFAYLGSHHGKYGNVQFADEHSFDLQRAYDIACLVYGSDPTKWAAVGGVLPVHRRARCVSEYKQKTRAFEALLRPHVRKR